MTIVGSDNSGPQCVESGAWDAIVIGAGPAGAIAARSAALSGLRTLLVDFKLFPRDKVCGGFLNNRALNVLDECGLKSVTSLGYNSPVRELHLVFGHQWATFPLPSGQIIRRQAFDAAVLDSARVAGATIQLETQATVEPNIDDMCRYVTISRKGQRRRVAAKVVICADGLARNSVRHLPEFTSTATLDSRVGIGAVVTGGDNAIPEGQLLMVASLHGYVGVSRVSHNQFNVAAAIDPQQLTHSSPVEIVRAIFEGSGIDASLDLDRATWRGTPLLTSKPRSVAADRVFLIGDSSGYIEPFTGEGMASALETGVAIAPLAAQAASKWQLSLTTAWTVLHRQLVNDRQLTCRQLAWILRRPWAAFAAIHLCRLFPSIALRMITKTSAPSRMRDIHKMTTT